MKGREEYAQLAVTIKLLIHFKSPPFIISQEVVYVPMPSTLMAMIVIVL